MRCGMCTLHCENYKLFDCMSREFKYGTDFSNLLALRLLNLKFMILIFEFQLRVLSSQKWLSN